LGLDVDDRSGRDHARDDQTFSKTPVGLTQLESFREVADTKPSNRATRPVRKHHLTSRRVFSNVMWALPAPPDDVWITPKSKGDLERRIAQPRRRHHPLACRGKESERAVRVASHRWRVVDGGPSREFRDRTSLSSAATSATWARRRTRQSFEIVDGFQSASPLAPELPCVCYGPDRRS
jgi:hypothetical protein